LDRRSFLAGLGSTITLLSIPGLGQSEKSGRDISTQKPPGRFGDLHERANFDVCIIGSGFAGAVLGLELVKHGVRTIILESGLNLDNASGDPRVRELEVFRSSGKVDYPIAKTRVRAVGGTSAIWTGRCPRLHPFDFENKDQSGAGAGWPLAYEELEPYYEKAEQILRVRGGELSKYNPHRKKRLPLPPDRDISSLRTLLQTAGVTVDDAPTSTGDDGHRPVRVARTYLPEFQVSPYASLVSGATVTRLLAGENGHLVGAEVKDLDRNVKIVRATVYVVACGGLESPRVLLLSRSRYFPNGIGNNYDWVGRCFMEHRAINFYGRVRTKSLQFYPQVGRSYQFDEESRKQKLGGMGLGFVLTTLNRSDLSGWDFGTAWERLNTMLSRVWRPELKISAGPEMPPCPDNRVTLDRKTKDYFGNPVTNLFLNESEQEQKAIEHVKTLVRKIYSDLDAERVKELDETWGHHHIGTCRMGDNPRTSVVDRNLRVHETKNLFVSGSSVFVTSGAANPTLTLTALSLRLADYLRKQLQEGDLRAESRGLQYSSSVLGQEANSNV
jgi:choline dehydrogenase-like flavoprotein